MSIRGGRENSEDLPSNFVSILILDDYRPLTPRSVSSTEVSDPASLSIILLHDDRRRNCVPGELFTFVIFEYHRCSARDDIVSVLFAVTTSLDYDNAWRIIVFI